ncbi:MAG: hypothetical protein JXR31_16760 [Prolixibacteraceae bacterium]|nr:hypothetical protein [Prolixibacteraceae bacterium]MBN2775910.1 hypothetical protein [Prolixibacteraceae bacterium]
MKKEEILSLMESWENVAILIQEIGNHPEHYDFLMDLALNSKEKNSWRAAWMVDKIHENHPELILPYKEQIIQKLKTNTDLSKKRHFLKQLSLIEIPEKHYGFLVDYCLNALSSAEPPAVRVHAMQILFNISEKEKDLKPELIHVIEQEIEYRSTAGIISRGTRLLKKLRKQVR